MPRFRGIRTIIRDGDDQSRVSRFDFQRFDVLRNATTDVDGRSFLTIRPGDRNVLLDNDGTVNQNSQFSAVRVFGDRAFINNDRTGEINADRTAVEIATTSQGSRIVNRGEINGDVNGVDFANGGRSSGLLTNVGDITSDSRAVNIGGNGVTVNNFGDIRGTDDQRNGTIYTDATAENTSILNQRSGTIDAGAGNQGAGIALETGNVRGDVVNARIVNRGEINGRGQADAASGLAGDGVRIFAGAEDVTFRGNIFNSGSITSESEVGTTAGIRVANGINFSGVITNARSGEISGANNGLYFGTGEHSALVRNLGTISSDSRAVNIDGSGVVVANAGNIVGTGDQRNGTVYADGTAEDYAIINRATGIIDAGAGNNGSAVSLQTGDVNGDTVSARVVNAGLIQGRGDATNGNTVGDGLRLFSSVEDATFKGDLINQAGGVIAGAEGNAAAVGISIEDGITLDGRIINQGRIVGEETAIDAREAKGGVIVENSGRIEGDVLLSSDADTFREQQGVVDGAIDGGDGIDTLDLSGAAPGVVVDLDLNTPQPGPASQNGAVLDAPGGNVVTEFNDFENVIGTSGDDLILGNNELNVLDGGAGNDAIHSFAGADIIIGGEGVDTALFTAGGGVVVDLDDNGDAVATIGGNAADQLFGFENINGSNNAASANGGADKLSGNAFDNVLNGQVGDDVLAGEGGNDTLIGGLGKDTFVFAPADAPSADTVTDFEDGDLIDVSAFGFTDLNDIGVAADGADVVLTFAADNTARLQNTDIADVDQNDFIFS